MINTEVIADFLNLEDLTEKNEHVLGVVFYGSAKYKTDTVDSDIDLLIVTDLSKNYKGVKYINNTKIEYLEKSIRFLQDEIDNLENLQNKTLFSIFKNGEIIFSKNYALENLRDQILSKSTLSPKIKSSMQSTNEWLAYFNQLPKEDDFYNYIFYNLLEILRRVYHRQNGYSIVPSLKIVDLYSNKHYTKTYYCLNLPNEEFRNFFIEAISSEADKDNLNTLISLVQLNNNSESCVAPTYTSDELKYLSTKVHSNLQRLIKLFNENSSAYLNFYYLVLEQIRKLYCNISKINDSIEYFGDNYSLDFLNMFNLCLTNINPKKEINQLFNSITSQLKLNYSDYHILDFHSKIMLLL